MSRVLNNLAITITILSFFGYGQIWTIFPVLESVLPQIPISNSIDQEKILSLIHTWDGVHIEADSTLTTNNLSTILRGEALREQLDTIQKLRDSNCYWNIVELDSPHITGVYHVPWLTTDRVIVTAWKNWDMDLYCNGRKTDDRDGWFEVQYEILQEVGNWYIANKRVTRS